MASKKTKWIILMLIHLLYSIWPTKCPENCNDVWLTEVSIHSLEQPHII